MKKLITLSFSLLICTFLLAQTSGGPDTYGYTWKNCKAATSPPSFNWLDISTTGTLVTGLGDDNYVGPFTIPGGFQYYWYTVNQFWIGSNGFISFNGDNIASPFPTGIPLATGANNFLAMHLSDLNFAGTGNPAKCYYQVIGDSIVVSFHDVPYWQNIPAGFTGSNTFQVIMNKADSNITFNYLDLDMGVNTGLDNIVGMENSSGTIGLQVLVDTEPDDSCTIVYEYPPVVTYAAIDAGVNWTGNPTTGGIFMSTYSDTLKLTANVKNYGNTTIPSITVDNEVLNNIGVQQTNGSSTVSSLAVNQDASVNFTNKFSTTKTGIYTYRASTSASGDAVITNDDLDQKIIAIDTTQNLMTLDYSDGIADGTGLGWNGGGGGIAIYIEPPMYPVIIKSSRFMITANGTPPAGFHALIYDDDGPNGGPGTLLDSAYRPPASIVLNNYTTVPTTNKNLIIMNGGVYLLWLMNGPNINLGRDINLPISRRTYEVLFGSWSTYRDYTTEDFLLGLNVASAAPKAQFSADPTLDPLVTFTDLSTNLPDKWKWTFGDGSPIDTNQNTSHTYQAIDTFEVCLRVSNFAGSDSICKNIEIKNIPPVADFVFTTTNMPTIAFSDISTNFPTKWHWDFDDGDTANTKNTTHTYVANGTYNVCLIASNVAGSDTVCKDVKITSFGIGIDENSKGNTLKVYPNPSNGITYVELDNLSGPIKVQFNCYDMSGKLIDLDYEVVNNRISFNANSLGNGSYLFEVFNLNEKLGQGRFMIKK